MAVQCYFATALRWLVITYERPPAHAAHQPALIVLRVRAYTGCLIGINSHEEAFSNLQDLGDCTEPVPDDGAFCSHLFQLQFARANGFARWLMLGEITSTLKSTVWPYFAIRHNALSVRNGARAIEPLTSVQIARLELKKMADALNASQQATYLINMGHGIEGEGIGSYDNIDKIVEYRKQAREADRKVSYEVLNNVYPELGSRFRDDFLTFIDTFLQAYDANSDELLKKADGWNDRWSDWYQANHKAIQVAADKAQGY